MIPDYKTRHKQGKTFREKRNNSKRVIKNGIRIVKLNYYLINTVDESWTGSHFKRIINH